MMRFTTREMFLLTVIAALLIALWIDARESRNVSESLGRIEQRMDARLDHLEARINEVLRDAGDRTKLQAP